MYGYRLSLTVWNYFKNSGGTAMQFPGKSGALLLLLAIVKPLCAQELPAPACEVILYDESTELADARNTADLNRSTFATYEKIFSMIEGLRKAKTIPEMDYIKAKYDRDAAKLTLEKADLILDRQVALVEQYRLICNHDQGNRAQERAAAIQKMYLQYRRADCNSLAKGIEIASTNLEYYREYLKKITKLRDDKFANNTQVILAELDVEHEEKNLADSKRRTTVCRAELTSLENGSR
jgi:hypothetical protein